MPVTVTSRSDSLDRSVAKEVAKEKRCGICHERIKRGHANEDRGGWWVTVWVDAESNHGRRLLVHEACYRDLRRKRKHTEEEAEVAHAMAAPKRVRLSLRLRAHDDDDQCRRLLACLQVTRSDEQDFWLRDEGVAVLLRRIIDKRQLQRHVLDSGSDEHPLMLHLVHRHGIACVSGHRGHARLRQCSLRACPSSASCSC